jgi:nicotinamide mononucleotide (NMN) deamidase PncC
MLGETPEGGSVITAAHVVSGLAELSALLDLSPAKLEAFGWVSQMASAEAALQLCDTYEGGWGLAVLGEAETAGDVYEDNTGRTFIALATPDATIVREYPFGGSGFLARRWVMMRALDLLRRQALARLAQKEVVSGG